MAYGLGWLVFILASQFFCFTDPISAGFVAKKLFPELILLPLNFDKYSEKSKEIIAIFKQYDPNMLVAGCDEGYMKCVNHFTRDGNGVFKTRDSITPYCSEHDLTPEACVQQMREKVKAQTRLTVSAGIAPNKVSHSAHFFDSLLNQE